MRIALISTSLLVLACAPALADPTSASAPASAPASTFELAVDPIGALADQYAASASVRVGQHTVIRGDGELDVSPGLGPTGETKRVAASVQLFLDRAFHGAYFEPGILVRDQPIAGECDTIFSGCAFGRQTTIALESLLGYQLTYASHYTIAAAIGMSKPLETYQPFFVDSGSQVETYVRLGYVW